jgi:hypothetical protein
MNLRLDYSFVFQTQCFEYIANFGQYAKPAVPLKRLQKAFACAIQSVTTDILDQTLEVVCAYVRIAYASRQSRIPYDGFQ